MPRKKNNQLEKLIGLHVKAAREEAGLSTPELAKRVGITYQQIHKFERGENRITVSLLLEIADICGLSPSDILASIDAERLEEQV